MGSLISYINLADTATITNSSDGTESIAPDNVQVRQVGKASRQTLITASPLESLIYDFDLTTAQSIDYVGIFGHNITSGTYTVSLGTTIGASDVATDSGTLWAGVSDIPLQQHIVFSQTYSARYVRVTLTPSVGQAVDVGRMWIGEGWNPKIGTNFELTIQDNSKSKRAIGGSVYSYIIPRYRSMKVSLNSMTEADAYGISSDSAAMNCAAMDFTAGIGSQIVIIPETTGSDATQVIHMQGIIGSIWRSTPITVIESRSADGWKYRKSFSVDEDR